jgi:predicted ABC-type ATPase
LRPRALIIAGPNGAGKTTFAREFLPRDADLTTFINADLIAAGLSPFKPEEAALRAMRLMAEAMHECVRESRDFAIETTLASRSYISLIREWHQAGYMVKIVFLRLQSIELALNRVRLRVDQGGHDVAEEVVRRRYVVGWQNFQSIYRPLADAWQVYDNSGDLPTLIEEGEGHGQLE